MISGAAQACGNLRQGFPAENWLCAISGADVAFPAGDPGRKIGWVATGQRWATAWYRPDRAQPGRGWGFRPVSDPGPPGCFLDLKPVVPRWNVAVAIITTWLAEVVLTR